MFYTFSPKTCPKWVPRWAQDGPRFRSRFWTNFWPHFDPILEPFFHHFWDPFWDQISLLRFAVFRQDEWQNWCTGNPLRTHLGPILERLGPPPRRQDPENSRWNWRCASPLCEPSSRPLWSDFGAILAPLNIANKLLGSVQERENRSKMAIFGLQRKTRKGKIWLRILPNSGGAQTFVKTEGFWRFA